MRISDWSSDVCSSDLSGSTGHDAHFAIISHISNIFGVQCPRSARIPHTAALRARRRSSPRAIPRFDGKDCPLCGCSLETKSITLLPTRSEEHTSELQSLMRISYAVFCLKKKKNLTIN